MGKYDKTASTRARMMAHLRGAIIGSVAILATTACEGENTDSQPLSYADPANPPESAPVPRQTTGPVTPVDPDDGATSDYFTGPAEMEKYVQKFVDDAQAEGLDVTTGLKKLKLEIQVKSLDAYGQYVIGLCETGTRLRRVTFDPEFWNSTSETQREIVAHHEFGHCVLYRGHRSDVLASGAYASIMYPQAMTSAAYTANTPYYLNELFTWNTAGISEMAAQVPTTHVCH